MNFNMNNTYHISSLFCCDISHCSELFFITTKVKFLREFLASALSSHPSNILLLAIHFIGQNFPHMWHVAWTKSSNLYDIFLRKSLSMRHITSPQAFYYWETFFELHFGKKYFCVIYRTSSNSISSWQFFIASHQSLFRCDTL